MPLLLGIDNGLTVTKAALFDETGRTMAIARRRVPQILDRPRHVERDMTVLWDLTAEAIAEVVAQCGRDPREIVGAAATAHGDGVYLLDADRRPLGPGVLSLDSRAAAIVNEWEANGHFPDMLRITGQQPGLSAPSAILAWIALHEPERFARIAHVLACKDWLRFCLTGTIGTDRTEASVSFTDVTTQAWSHEALAVYGLEALWQALPPIAHPSEIVGHVTAEAARRTGLVAGTPVAAGLHDVVASALGMGGHREGVCDVIAGTYSINEAVVAEPRIDSRWFCRSALDAGQWNLMSISPASTANYDWFLDRLCATDQAAALTDRRSFHTDLRREMEAAPARSTLFFHPFLFGSPHGGDASGGFYGLRGWHQRGDMIRAMLEGVLFNHRAHVDDLRLTLPFAEVRLTGGGSRNPDFAQMAADIFVTPVTVPDVEEPAALAAAFSAGHGIGLLDSPQRSIAAIGQEARRYEPDPVASRLFADRYQLYRDIVTAMMPVWRRLEAHAGAAA